MCLNPLSLSLSSPGSLLVPLHQLSVLRVFQNILNDRAARRDPKLADMHAFALDFVRRFFAVSTPKPLFKCMNKVQLATQFAA
jgi:hypothetical protein